MKLKTELLLALIAIPVGGFFWFGTYFWHDMPKSISFAGVFACAAVFFVLLAWNALPAATHRSILDNAPLYMIGGALLLTIGGVMLYRFQTASVPAQQSELRTRAESDFMRAVLIGGTSHREELITLNPIRSPMPTVQEWLWTDLTYMAKLLVIYIPNAIDTPSETGRTTFDTCMILAERFPSIVSALEQQGHPLTGPMGDPYERSGADAKFTGAIYIYYEGDLTEDERSKVRAAFKAHGGMVFFRNKALLLEEKGVRATEQ